MGFKSILMFERLDLWKIEKCWYLGFKLFIWTKRSKSFRFKIGSDFRTFKQLSVKERNWAIRQLRIRINEAQQ